MDGLPHQKKKKTNKPMKTKLTSLIISLVTLLSIDSTWGAALSAADKAFLSNYEKVGSALAADDLTQAKEAGAALGETGINIAQSQSLADARASFAQLSEKAEKLVADQSGYYVVHCPMAKKDWVQTSATISNPYLGKEMAGCGEIKK